MVVGESLRMQETKFYHYEILKLMSRWDECINMAGDCVGVMVEYTGWTQRHSLISSSNKIKTYWNILTKLVAAVA